ncbi:Plant UBX domain-containing protein 1 [Linum perenne]
MIVDSSSSPLHLKRRRLTTLDSMEAQEAKAKFAAVKEKFGRDLRVFETSPVSASPSQVSNDDDSDDFYEFTAEDYYRISGKKKDDKTLKTRKLREAEEAARRSKITKAVIRVRFPDNHTLEVPFQSSEKIQCLFDLLTKAVAHPEKPFYLYTTPPKKQIKDLSVDFYSAGFIPGAIVYFSYDLPKAGDDAAVTSGPYLQEEIMSLKGLDIFPEPVEPVHTTPEPSTTEAATAAPPPQERKPADRKLVKPKWMK